MTENITAGEGGGAADWRSGLSDDLRGSPALADFKDMNGLAKSFIDTQAKLGERPGMADLDAPTDSDARSKVFGKLGRPDAPDGYKLADGDGGKEFRIVAHKFNLTAEQAEGLYKEMSDTGKAGRDRQAGEFAEQLKTLATKTEETYKAKWGDDYDANHTLTRAAMESTIPAEELAELKELGLTNSPWLIDLMHRVGQASKEDKMFRGDSSGAGGDDLKTVQAKRMAMDSDDESVKIREDFMHPQHKAKVAEYDALFEAEAKMATKEGTFQPWD